MPLPPGRPLVLPGRGQTWVLEGGDPAAPPVLLLHGWTSTAALNWFRCFGPLSERHRVVAMDQRGHGRGIRSRRPFRLDDCAEDAAAAIEALELGPVTVVGYSMGGAVAQIVSRRRPDLLAGVVLCATAARFPFRRFAAGGSPLAATALNQAALGTATGLSISLSLLPRAVQAYGMGLATRSWSASAPWAAEEWSRHDPGALIQAGMALARFDSRPWLGQISVPAAVVTTDADVTVHPRRQLELVEGIPGARRYRVEGDHRVVVDHPRRFLPALMHALDDTADTTRTVTR